MQEFAATSTPHGDLLMLSLAKFYSNADHIDCITPIIQGKSPISLRLLDWFVTNYSKKRSTFINTTNVYISYRSQLKAYSKQQFDPFRRRDRIAFFYDAENSIETTIGQLNFFRWVIQNDILTYITENLAAIEKDMFSVQKKTAELAAPGDSKRCELSKSFVKNMNRFDCVRTIDFN